MGIFELVKNEGKKKLKVINYIHMGDTNSTDVYEYISEPFVIFEGEETYINKNIVVEARIASNGWLEITFEDGTSCDIACDNLEDYNKYFKLVE